MIVAFKNCRSNGGVKNFQIKNPTDIRVFEKSVIKRFFGADMIVLGGVGLFFEFEIEVGFRLHVIRNDKKRSYTETEQTDNIPSDKG